MLGFDRTRGCFVFEGVAIGPGIPAAPIAAALDAEVRPMPDAPDWTFFDLDSPALGASVTCLRGLVHSGYFWAHVPGGGWDEYAGTEQQRRAAHARILRALFGADRFEDHAIRVELVRDPRSGLEQIAFEAG